MAASKRWCKDAADALVRAVGRENAVKAVDALTAVPGANRSAVATLVEVRSQLFPPELRARARRSLVAFQEDETG